MVKKVSAFDYINVVLSVLFALVCIYPFYYLLTYSLSDSVEAAKGSAWLFPVKMNVENYARLFVRKEILNAFFISTARTVLGTAITVVCSSFFAFVLAKRELLFRRTIYRMLIITMYLNAGLIPYFIIMKTYGLNNNFLLYIIPSAVGAFFVILVKTYIEQIPDALEEAARMDGAGHLIVYWRIIMPICLPVLATIAIYSAVGQWNSWQDNLFLVRDRTLKTLQLQLLEYLQSMDSTIVSDIKTASMKAGQVSTMSIKASISVITMIPIICVYPFLQRYFIKGILIGSIKG